MKRTLVLVILVILQASPLLAQQRKYKKPVEWQFTPSVGRNFPLTDLLKNVPTDYLLSYKGKSMYWQFISATLFIDKHWGFEVNIRSNTSSSLSRNRQNFTQAVMDAYSDRYFVDLATNAIDRKGGFWNDASMSGYLGVIYRMQAGRFFVHPQLAVGVTSWYVYYARVGLKEKGTNQYARLVYQDVVDGKDNFTLAASLAVGYRINHWLGIHAELLGSRFKTSFNFNKVLTDLNTKDILTSERTNYNTTVLTLSPGIGLKISLAPRPSKKTKQPANQPS